MTCEEFKDNIASLIEADDMTDQLNAHMSKCPECAEHYRRTMAALSAVTPTLLPDAPESLKVKILNELDMTAKTFFQKKTIRKISRIAASAALFFIAAYFIFGVIVSGPEKANAAAARVVFEKSLASAGHVQSMVMNLNIRTTPRENFAMFFPDYDMVENTITVLPGNPGKWRFEKAGRVVLCDGERQYMWSPEFLNGSIGPLHAGFIDWFIILMEPAAILNTEKAATNRTDMKYSIKETDSEIFLTVKGKAKGELRNKHFFNHAISTSDNRREYIFDKNTHLIKSLKIFVKKWGREILVFETTGINYDVTVDENLFTIPEGVDWHDLSIAPVNEILSNISAEEAAAIIFDRLSKGDLSDIKESFGGANIKRLEESFKGISIIKIGKAKRGIFGKTVVPYIIKFPNTLLPKVFFLSLTNHNPNKVWVFDGGL